MWYLIVSIPDLCNLTYFETIAIASAQRINYNEQYSRKNNIKILSITEIATESERTLTEVICSTLLSKGNVDLDPYDIIAMHRIPGKKGSPKEHICKDSCHETERNHESCWV